MLCSDIYTFIQFSKVSPLLLHISSQWVAKENKHFSKSTCDLDLTDVT